MTTPIDDITTITALSAKNHLSLCGGVSKKGNWMVQKMKCETICCDVIPTDSGI